MTGEETTRRAGRASGRDATPRTTWREEPRDYVAAALIGAALGAGAAFALQQGFRERDRVHLVRRPGRGLARGMADAMGGMARGSTRRGAFWAGRRSGAALTERAAHLAERFDVEGAREQLREAVEEAREAVSDAVRHEMRDLRRALRRQRKRLGL